MLETTIKAHLSNLGLKFSSFVKWAKNKPYTVHNHTKQKIYSVSDVDEYEKSKLN